MKNIERFNNEIECEVSDGIGDLGCMLYKVRTNSEQCKHKGKCSDCMMESIKWLNAEYVEKPKLTHAEKVILENIDDCWKWITRDNVYETLEMHMTKPLRNNNYWESGSDCCFGMFDDLFQFVKWEDEPLEIAWLLENCEVIEE